MHRLLNRILKRVDSRRYMYLWTQEVKEDFLNNKDTTIKQKIWAYRKGFRSSKIIMYGLNGINYGDYLSDYDYYRLQPINSKFRKWIDDKLTLKYVLQPFNDYLPRYFFQLDNQQDISHITRLMDCPPQYAENAEDIVKLLEVEGCLAVKLMAGQFGEGFYKLAYQAGQYYVNDKTGSKNEIITLLHKLNKYIMTEYIFGHKDLGKICNNKGNSLRIMTVKEEGLKPQIACSFMRFSTERSGSVDNISAGGVAAFVDIQNGCFKNGRILVKDEWVKCQLHPNTKLPMEGKLPFWHEITEIVLAICNYIPQIRFMGFDIIITDTGFKIIEINSMPAVALHNYYSPMLTNDLCSNFFKKLIAAKNK